MNSKIEYRVCGMEEYEYPENMWDCVISNLALHYIKNIEHIFQKVYRTLKPNGVFVLNIEHPVFTAGIGQDWIYSKVGKPQYHTLTQILMGLLNNGFELETVEEAKPPKEMMNIPGMEDELRRPMMLLVRAIVKNK